MTDQLTLTSAADFSAITLDDVRAAAGRINGAVVRTPTLHSQTLSEMVGAEVWLKFENLQFTAAYKERGALNALLLLDDEAKARGVIAASAGNHAQGLRSEEHTSELQSLMRISYAVFCLKKKKYNKKYNMQNET